MDANKASARRSIWLRAYARVQRWEEEKEIVLGEMEWTVQYFRFQASKWQAWRQRSTREGQTAYAARSAAMWTTLADHAAGVFSKAKIAYKP